MLFSVSAIPYQVFSKEGRRERIVMPIHGNKPLKTGLMRSLMKIADIEVKDL